MTDSTDILNQLMAIAIPITATDRSQAKTFAEQQPTRTKAEQVYRNTIAVLVVHRCLQLLGIESDLESSDSWNPLHQQLEDVADLYIPKAEGCLECRTIRPRDTYCLILEPTRSDRIGYVVVQLDDTYRKGQVLGFTESVASTQLALSELQPLDFLIEHLCVAPINLENWLQHQFDQGWELYDPLIAKQRSTSPLTSALRSRLRPKLDEIARRNKIQQRVEQLYLKQPSPSLELPSAIGLEASLVHLIQMAETDETRWQAAELLWQLDPEHSACPIMSAKDLGLYLKGHRIALVVGILAKSDGSRLTLLRLYPFESELYLPPGLKLIGLDESGSQLFEVESRERDDYIQFKFTADVGDRFTLRLVLDDAIFTESFVI